MRVLAKLSIHWLFFISTCMALAGCGPFPAQQPTRTATAYNTSTAARTLTPSLTQTFTLPPTSTSSPTSSSTPTTTSTPTITPSPTFNYPKVTVNQTFAACLFGPAKAYLWARDLKKGDTGVVWGRAPYGSNWLYVRMDRWPDNPCWVSPYVVDVVGDPNTMIVESIRLPITNALYNQPTNVEAERQGDQVIVTWDPVWRTQDDDYGYFLEVWVCQGGNFVWVPASLPTQNLTQYTFTDQQGCSEQSHGELRTVEKHGYTDAVQIPWPP